MKISSFDTVVETVQRLRQLRAAKDGVKHYNLKAQVSTRQSEIMDLAGLTSLLECRHALEEVLDRHIATCIRDLKTYGVDDE
jgi:hypothetical protein